MKKFILAVIIFLVSTASGFSKEAVCDNPKLVNEAVSHFDSVFHEEKGAWHKNRMWGGKIMPDVYYSGTKYHTHNHFDTGPKSRMLRLRQNTSSSGKVTCYGHYRGRDVIYGQDNDGTVFFQWYRE